MAMSTTTKLVITHKVTGERHAVHLASEKEARLAALTLELAGHTVETGYTTIQFKTADALLSHLGQSYK